MSHGRRHRQRRPAASRAQKPRAPDSIRRTTGARRPDATAPRATGHRRARRAKKAEQVHGPRHTGRSAAQRLCAAVSGRSLYPGATNGKRRRPGGPGWPQRQHCQLRQRLQQASREQVHRECRNHPSRPAAAWRRKKTCIVHKPHRERSHPRPRSSPAGGERSGGGFPARSRGCRGGGEAGKVCGEW